MGRAIIRFDVQLFQFKRNERICDLFSIDSQSVFSGFFFHQIPYCIGKMGRVFSCCGQHWWPNRHSSWLLSTCVTFKIKPKIRLFVNLRTVNESINRILKRTAQISIIAVLVNAFKNYWLDGFFFARMQFVTYNCDNCNFCLKTTVKYVLLDNKISHSTQKSQSTSYITVKSHNIDWKHREMDFFKWAFHVIRILFKI